MDAEIGVRNLADSFRYNVLSDMVRALDLTHGKLGHGFETFEDLPEYEKLSMLSRDQAELTYAVNRSLIQAKVTMSDSLTASMKWCQYDEGFRQKNGYRLPADPYWLAPPQGSIIPVWHRGGAPNYQPKPMISKHVQDPIEDWGREKHLCPIASQPSTAVVEVQELQNLAAYSKPETRVLTYEVTGDVEPLPHSVPSPRPVDTVQNLQLASRCIEIYFCSAEKFAEKLATKLHQWTSSYIEKVSNTSLNSKVESLNSLYASDLTADKIFLLIVSSTG
ncbi:hypothetical protein OEA41_010083 [Lepraria neglecta]|uniref:Nitric oxide synthase (NOS) domain-containing protein n=1 Tax=Lepraria neglecta TaxID=209136 RepID=A0AAD9Z039_9LECA|nr:hypothetical protein OEA41_010083 [Lepraria neglecta]